MTEDVTDGNERVFSLDEARVLLPQAREHAAQIVRVRADLAELAMELRAGGESDRGGVAEAKAMEARLDELVSWFTEQGIEVKGLAPVLVDFPSMLEGASVRLCWLEGEHELNWYHRTELGFVGRRPLSPE